MPVIAPTITASRPDEYRRQIEQIESFAHRVHIDFSDGEFSPVRMVNPIEAYWPEHMLADLHCMLMRPLEHLETLISMQPNVIIFHAESDNALQAITEVQRHGIQSGVALLKDTFVGECQAEIQAANHVLLFGGELGYQGGKADLSVLSKVPKIRELNPNAELAWDGGINAHTISEIAAAGISVMNVGGFIQKSDNPAHAYDILSEVLSL